MDGTFSSFLRDGMAIICSVVGDVGTRLVSGCGLELRYLIVNTSLLRSSYDAVEV